jgi:membrane-bound ClpP family serine protease
MRLQRLFVTPWGWLLLALVMVLIALEQFSTGDKTFGVIGVLVVVGSLVNAWRFRSGAKRDSAAG